MRVSLLGGSIRYLFVETEAEEIIKNVSDVDLEEARGDQKQAEALSKQNRA